MEGVVCGLGLNPLQPFPKRLDPQIADSPKLVWITADAVRQAMRDSAAYHIMSPFELSVSSQSVVPPFVLEAGAPLVVTLYDLIPLIFAEQYFAGSSRQRAYHTRLELIRQADLVLTISESTRQDALAHLQLDPARVFTIGCGVPAFFRPPPEGNEPREVVAAALPGITRPYVLTVGGSDERKNINRLIEAFAGLSRHLRTDLQLVVVCQIDERNRARWEAWAATCGLHPADLVITDLVSDAVLKSLYQAASLFVFPSTYEGFGLPAAEAAACGCATITSNTSAVREVLNFPAATFDPLEVETMTSLMERSLTDDDFRRVLRDFGSRVTANHRWERVAGRTVEAVATLTTPRPRRSRSPARRRRLALAGQFPPTRSGIADYNGRLAAELSKICELDLYSTEHASRTGRRPGGDTPMFPLNALGRSINPYGYDAVIYALGNSAHHHRTYEKAVRYPGVVWLHDVRLSGFYLSYAIAEVGPPGTARFMADKLDYLYRSRTPAELASQPSFDMDTYNQAGLGLTGELAHSARAMIVNSTFARRLLELDQGPFISPPPVRVIPLAIPNPPSISPIQRQRLLIGSFGIGGQHKAPELLIEALSVLRSRIPAELVFVGPQHPDLLQSLRASGRLVGVSEAVRFTGEVDEATYWEWLGRVTCAAQVRSTTHGESSAAINDCLAAGVPVITNSPSCADLPPGTVELLHPDASPRELADRMHALLTDASLRNRLSQAGLGHSTVATFAGAAREVLDFVGTLAT
jgi:glycosyltransferase involved in cell wall biosynthesis